VKRIALPPTEDGYYSFGELPAIIAGALHQDEHYPDDRIMWVVIWRDDGSEHGQYIELTPPADQRATSLEGALQWPQRAIELTDEEKTHPDRCKWVHWRWHEQRRPECERNYLPDGSLIVQSEETQNHVHQVVSIRLERDWYKDRMSKDARRGHDDLRRLCVVDGNLNGLTNTHGAALDRGWVHIDRLNQWGATLETVNVFCVDEVQQAAQAERRPTVQEAIADYVAVVMRANPAYTAERLYGHMRREAGTEGSPFATLVNGGEMFCAEASAPCGQASVTAALTAYRKGLKRR
jgi:hypothetical protein